MQQTLFYIPDEIAGMPMFGMGLLLAVWALGGAVWLAWLLRRQGFNSDTQSHLVLLAVVGAVIWFVLPRLSEPGLGVPVRGYGTLILIGVLLGVGLAIWRGRPLGLDADLIVALSFWIVLPGMVGARIFYVVEYWENFYQPPAGVSASEILDSTLATLRAVLNLAQGGLVVYGSLIGGLLGMLAFIRYHRLPVLKVFDLMMPSMVLGAAIGRIGCFLNGCCFGGVCELPWSVHFPAGSPPYRYQAEHHQLGLPSQEAVRGGTVFLNGLKVLGPPEAKPQITAVEPGSEADRRGLKPGMELKAVNGVGVSTVAEAQAALFFAYRSGPMISLLTDAQRRPVAWRLSGPPQHSLPVHPTQLYSAIDAALLCFFLLAYSPFRRRDGELLALALTFHPISRFLMEIIRTDEPGQFGTALTISQWFSVAILLAVVPLWWYILRQAPRPRVSEALR